MKVKHTLYLYRIYTCSNVAWKAVQSCLHWWSRNWTNQTWFPTVGYAVLYHPMCRLTETFFSLFQIAMENFSSKVWVWVWFPFSSSQSPAAFWQFNAHPFFGNSWTKTLAEPMYRDLPWNLCFQLRNTAVCVVCADFWPIAVECGSAGCASKCNTMSRRLKVHLNSCLGSTDLRQWTRRAAMTWSWFCVLQVISAQGSQWF